MTSLRLLQAILIIDGMSDEDILIMWPIIYQYATDSSNAYYLAHPQGSDQNQGEYANFKVHRPINTHVWPENDYDEYFNRWYPPTDDYSGGAIFHRLVDQVDKGMPGVWVQERFRYPEQIPPDASVNTHHTIWVTKRRRTTFTQINFGWLSFYEIFNFSKKATTADRIELPFNPVPEPGLYPRHIKTIEGNGQKGG